MRYAKVIMSVLCAWVLWEKVDHMAELASPSHVSWTMYSAQDTKTACETRTQSTAKRIADMYSGPGEKGNGLSVSVDGSIIIVSVSGGLRRVHQFTCLPDTSDPRELISRR